MEMDDIDFEYLEDFLRIGGIILVVVLVVVGSTLYFMNKARYDEAVRVCESNPVLLWGNNCMNRQECLKECVGVYLSG